MLTKTSSLGPVTPLFPRTSVSSQLTISNLQRWRTMLTTASTNKHQWRGQVTVFRNSFFLKTLQEWNQLPDPRRSWTGRLGSEALGHPLSAVYNLKKKMQGHFNGRNRSCRACSLKFYWTKTLPILWKKEEEETTNELHPGKRQPLKQSSPETHSILFSPFPRPILLYEKKERKKIYHMKISALSVRAAK